MKTPGELIYIEESRFWLNAIPWRFLSEETKQFWENRAYDNSQIQGQ